MSFLVRYTHMVCHRRDVINGISKRLKRMTIELMTLNSKNVSIKKVRIHAHEVIRKLEVMIYMCFYQTVLVMFKMGLYVRACLTIYTFWAKWRITSKRRCFHLLKLFSGHST